MALGDDHYVLSDAKLVDGFAEGLFALAVDVGGGGIEEATAEVEGGANVARVKAVGAAHFQNRNPESRLAEQARGDAGCGRRRVVRSRGRGRCTGLAQRFAAAGDQRRADCGAGQEGSSRDALAHSRQHSPYRRNLSKPLSTRGGR